MNRFWILLIFKPLTKFNILPIENKKNMKKLIAFVLVVLIATASYSQRGKERKAVKAGSNKQVEANEVPDAVKSAFKSPATDVRWEKQEGKGKAGKSHVRYVAVYTQDGVRTRSRFKEDGSPMSSSKYMGGQKLPAAIQTAATAKNPGATLVGGEEFTTKDGKVYYRVRTRNGATKSTTLFDANGAEVTKDKITDEHRESEDEDGGN